MNPNWTQGDILIDGKRIHYCRTGPAGSGKPAVVLVHGFSDSGLCWQTVAEELETDYDVVMPDARGHGLSERVQRDEKLDMPADLAGVIRALGLQRPVVGGHSMGAGEAALLGARFPEIVGGLFLEDPPWWQPANDDFRPGRRMEGSQLGQWALSLPARSLRELLDECHAEHPSWPETDALRWCEGKKQLDPNIVYTDNDFTGDWRQVSAAVACPALLITADTALGGIVTPELAAAVVAENPNFRVAHIAGVGHHVRFAGHAAYMHAVRTFIDAIAVQQV